MAAGYVTNYGNDENDGLSWATPKRTVQSAADNLLVPIYTRDDSNESMIITSVSSAMYFEGLGNTFDGGNVSDYFMYYAGVAHTYTFYNLVIKNISKLFQASYLRGTTIEKCKLIGLDALFVGNLQNTGYIKNTLIGNFNLETSIDVFDSTTIYNSSIKTRIFYGYKCKNNIISESKINCLIELSYSPDNIPRFYYTLFHNCTFQFSGGGLGTDETVFSAPTGLNDTEKLENLRSRMSIVYGGVASQYLMGCRYQTDGDLFIDPVKENFYLVPGCQAASMAYDAQFIGKYPEGSTSDFATDFVSYTNLDVSGNVIDQTVDATAETTIKDLGKLRHINSLESLGQRATRNGNAINVDEDLGPNILPGTSMIAGSTYIVRTEAISLTTSGKVRDIGETFIANLTDGLEFTSVTGYIQEVYIDKPRSIEIKVSKTDATLSTTVWLKMDLYAEPRINYDANGIPQYGNLDIGYDEATSELLFIRYWKARIIIQASNLPA